MTIESSYLKGTIGEFALPDIIQLISLGGKSGRLLLCDASSNEGCFYFEYGYLIHAVRNGLEGEAAAHSLVSLDAGTFEFTPGKVPRERTVKLTGHELLMRAAQRADEDALPEQDKQLVLEIEDGPDAVINQVREKIKELLQLHLGRRSRQPVIAIEASEDTMDSLLETCERIERYIALFVDEDLAEETGKRMREVMGLI